MIEGIIESVLEAEKLAEKTKNDADEKSRKSVELANGEAFRIKENSIKNGKELKSSILSEAKKKADDEYKRAIEEAKVEAEKFKTEKEPDVEKMAEELVRRIIDGSC